ncbi:Dolichyl-phosphate-mannose-protein mannosyltransferase [Butyrivibrio sp. INlla18]|uniref:DUF6020 family protein n=1 Tax=Butyrivibrio sp. INlla18 TaxID=1520806 RepID=UPI00088C0D57|nr:DUF6020 family protein [Butyrivibrio sp. INlla18]SDA69827.1 Dolichyl-phosphate-mannose-protein mannosyltransferase [Butyrivibrio sp. INlla18]
MKKNVFKIITIIYWLMVLVNTDSYYWVYLLLGGAALFSFSKKLADKTAKSTVFFGSLFSLMVILANYETALSFYEGTGKAFYILYTGVSAVFMILGGVYVYTSVFELVHQIVDKGLVVISEGNEKKVSPFKFFWLSFAGISLFYLLILFLFNYPGIVSPDAIHQLRMIRDNAYSDHHPLAHTLMIKLFFGFGAEIFGSANAGVAVYSVFQILCVAATFAFLFMTIYEMGGNYKKIAVITEVVYAILPYNIEFSVSMRKDTLFSLCILLFIVALYRLSRSEKTLCDSIVFSVSSFGICLLRNNGMMIFLACAVIFAIMFKNKKKAELMIMSIIAVFSLAITPMMKNELNAVSPDYLEKVGVPMQQVVRVVVDGYELTDNQNKIAEKLFGGV